MIKILKLFSNNERPPSWNGEYVTEGVSANILQSLVEFGSPAFTLTFNKSTFTNITDLHTEIHIKNLNWDKARFDFSGAWDVKICKHLS